MFLLFIPHVGFHDRGRGASVGVLTCYQGEHLMYTKFIEFNFLVPFYLFFFFSFVYAFPPFFLTHLSSAHRLFAKRSNPRGASTASSARPPFPLRNETPRCALPAAFELLLATVAIIPDISILTTC